MSPWSFACPECDSENVTADHHVFVCAECGYEFTSECQIDEVHCRACGQTDVSRPNDGYSTCCNKPTTNRDECENYHAEGDA